MLLWELFATFFRIGLFTIGGGYVMLPLMKREVIETHGWLTGEEFTDILAIAEMTPGPIAVNTSTFVGYRLAGVPGSLAGTLGVILPSLLVILTIATLLHQYRLMEWPRVQGAFTALRPAVLGLIAAAVFSLARAGISDVRGALIAVGAFAIISLTDWHPALVLVAAALLGGLFLGSASG